MKNLQVALEEADHKRLKRMAADTGETLANLIRQAVLKLVDEHERHAERGEGPQP